MLSKEETFVGESGTVWRYWSDKRLGTPGGFGQVYAGAGPDGAAVAVKAVPKHRPSGTIDDRLLRREVEIGKRVADAAAEMLLPVIDVKETADALLLVMVRADGALADTALPLDEAATVSVMTDITAGLQELHNIGVIHRDLKPANVLRHHNRWKLADFGIARDEEIGTQNPTFVGWGSPPYMSPELWNGRSPTVKTDLYALGCLSFELLSGVAPYVGNRAAIREGHLARPVPEAPASNTALRNLITRLLAKEPGGRPQDARAVLERLQRVAQPRSPVQERITHGFSIYLTEKNRESMDLAAAEALDEVRQQRVAQARADLLEIMNDAFEDLQDVEPNVIFQNGKELELPLRVPAFPSIDRYSIVLAVDDVRLRIDVWEHGISEYPLAGDSTMLLACAVMISNRWYVDELNAANLVYEPLEDRLGWQLYRFGAGTMRAEKYPYGPHGRLHGLNYEDFFGQWARWPADHPSRLNWQKTVEPLTTGTAMGLFQEAVDLRPPDARTGVWRRP